MARVVFNPTKFSLTVRETRGNDAVMHGTIRHPSCDSVHIMVRPPPAEGEPAMLDVRISDMLVDVVEGWLDTDAALMFGDLEMCIAWAWLRLRGHSS